MTNLTMTLTTLTPLWTGGVDERCDRIYESGILGSLRWWYEAIVRGLGGEACDPKIKRAAGPSHPCHTHGGHWLQLHQAGQSAPAARFHRL